MLPDLPPADVVPRARKRPDRATVARLLATDGHIVTATRLEITTDVDGIPAHAHRITETGMFTVSLGLLGWTQAEYDDPTITE